MVISRNIRSDGNNDPYINRLNLFNKKPKDLPLDLPLRKLLEDSFKGDSTTSKPNEYDKEFERIQTLSGKEKTKALNSLLAKIDFDYIDKSLEIKEIALQEGNIIDSTKKFSELILKDTNQRLAILEKIEQLKDSGIDKDDITALKQKLITRKEFYEDIQKKVNSNKPPDEIISDIKEAYSKIPTKENLRKELDSELERLDKKLKGKKPLDLDAHRKNSEIRGNLEFVFDILTPTKTEPPPPIKEPEEIKEDPINTNDSPEKIVKDILESKDPFGKLFELSEKLKKEYEEIASENEKKAGGDNQLFAKLQAASLKEFQTKLDKINKKLLDSPELINNTNPNDEQLKIYTTSTGSINNLANFISKEAKALKEISDLYATHESDAGVAKALKEKLEGLKNIDEEFEKALKEQRELVKELEKYKGKEIPKTLFEKLQKNEEKIQQLTEDAEKAEIYRYFLNEVLGYGKTYRV